MGFMSVSLQVFVGSGIRTHHGNADRRHREESLAGARRLWWS
jgi:hypothetical protein